jgi:7,8-dihydropterin-6-yl-methyl-4-(beta-D-ribofuranosyl)aminobenzene 5'-phosphate synthase
MELKITILAENSVVGPFSVIGEHGFSAFVETKYFNFLFDTGQGKALINNAMALKKDLSSIKFLYLSHGHYDHTGGLVDLLKIKSPLDIYAHPDIFLERYWIKDEVQRYIGIPFSRAYLQALGANFIFHNDFQEIAKNVFSSGEVIRNTSFEKIDKEMKIKNEKGEFVQDQILDDYSIAIKTTKGLVIILGCAHSGIVNILNHFIEKTGEKEIYAVLGGTHLGFANEEQINETIKFLNKYNIQKLGVSHCTGLSVSAKLFAQLKEKFFFASVGSSLEI